MYRGITGFQRFSMKMPPYGNPNSPRRILNPLSPEFKNVQLRPNTVWRKTDTFNTYCRHVDYTFWTALSETMYGEESFWDEPRYPRYSAMEDYAVNRFGTVRPYSNSDRQLDPDGASLAATGPIGANGLFTGEVGPEMWQFVADCYGIKLFVLIAHGHPGQRDYTIVPRGDHNGRQIFLFLEEDGEYRGVLPVVDGPASFRFNAHMPEQLVVSPQTPAAKANAVTDSNEMRCPYLVVDMWNLPIFPPVPISSVIGVNVPANTPRPLGRSTFHYVAPFIPLEPISWDANINPAALLFSTASEHFNPVSGKWI